MHTANCSQLNVAQHVLLEICSSFMLQDFVATDALNRCLNKRLETILRMLYPAAGEPCVSAVLKSLATGASGFRYNAPLRARCS